jgi:hypothetical protein
MVHRLTYILIFIILSQIVDGQSLNDFEFAFKKKSEDLLKMHLTSWSTDEPYSSDLKLNDTLEVVSKIYYQFYTPIELSKFDSIDKFLIIQNKIFLSFTPTLNIDTIKFELEGNIDTSLYLMRLHGFDEDADYWTDYVMEDLILENKSEYDSIISFRPLTRYPNDRTLFLTNERDSILNGFLGNQHYAFARGGIMNPARAKKKSFKKQLFLNRYLSIRYGHWGGYWHIATHPYIQYILFDNCLSRAVVFYRDGYGGGEAHYQLIDNKWIELSYENTWIE